MNLKMPFEEVVFRIEELDAVSRAIHERAVLRAQRFLVAEAELLESIIEVDQKKTYEKFGVNYLTTYCVKHLGLADDVAGILVRVARKSQAVPELRQAIAEGDVSISNARTISSVITKENQSEWIEKARTLSKNKLEREVAKSNGKNYVQVVLNLTEEEFDLRCRIKDLVSQTLGKSASDAEVEMAMIKLYQFHKDPVKKAERAATRKSKAKDTSQDGSEKIPAPIEHHVNLRDQRRCQGRHEDGSICGSTRWVHLHHIIPKSEGGQDTVENITTLCSAHHRLWHKRAKSRNQT